MNNQHVRNRLIFRWTIEVVALTAFFFAIYFGWSTLMHPTSRDAALALLCLSLYWVCGPFTRHRTAK